MFRKILLIVIASLPLAALVLLALICDVVAGDFSKARYCVIENTKPNRVLIRNCISSGRCPNRANNLRTSVDGTKVIVKWTVPEGVGPPEVRPAALNSVCAQVLTHAEAHALVRTPEWMIP